jgi:hypothetical protein
MGWIYLIRNTVNGKCYVGQTRRKIERRWREHKSGRGNSPLLQNSIKKRGIDKFHFEVICELPNEELNAREIDEIIKHNSLAPHGYNLKKGGDNHELHPETRHKISESLKGENNPFFGKFGGSHGHAKEVEQFKDGLWISYPSIEDAARETGAPRRGISDCCRNRQKTAGGFEWRYRPVEPKPDAPRSVVSAVNSVETSLTSATV